MAGMNNAELLSVAEALPSSVYDKHTIERCVDNLMDLVHDKWANPRGWWIDLVTQEDLRCDYPSGGRPKGSKAIGEQISLIHTEISEAYEGHRKNKTDEHCTDFLSIEVELADAMIRICDMAGGLNLRLAEAFSAKMLYNHARPDHRPENRLKADGKKT